MFEISSEMQIHGHIYYMNIYYMNTTTKHLTDKYIRHAHTHRQHTATYQINNLKTQTSREGSNSTKHERRPPEDGQTIVTETCRVLMMCFTNIFNNLVF